MIGCRLMVELTVESVESAAYDAITDPSTVAFLPAIRSVHASEAATGSAIAAIDAAMRLKQRVFIDLAIVDDR